ncbi:MAG: response regulator [Alphaproteobacteria bacterium]|nr:response regulator [Alphaproteobacteria bacterium]
MTIATQMLQAAMPELRSRYATRLRTQSSELLDFISRCERGKLTDEACVNMRTLAHSLCGTGRTFGFPEISDAAGRLENAIDAGTSNNAQTYIELTLRLLRACDPAIQSAEIGAVDDSDTVAPQALEQPLLLCMSDDHTTVTILKQMFSARMEIVSTTDQIEALDLIRFSNPAAVIFDMAPEHFMAGLEALYQECTSQCVPLIAITPNRQAAAVAHAMSAGAVQCVVKPLSVEKLYHCAHTTIERGRLMVLVADDDVIVREMMVNRFKAAGFSVIGASDGAQVLDMAARQRPSIIVLDRIMPGIEGVTILRMLKANPLTHEIPVIMLSAKRKADEIAEARRAGATDYIVKPFKPDQIVQRCIDELGLSVQATSERRVVSLPTTRRTGRASYRRV